MPFSRSERLQMKAEAAMLGAIEVYNKPNFPYREETFAILMLNAWELLLKARILLDNANDYRALLVYDTRLTKGGSNSKRTYVRKNRSGNAFTKSLGQVIDTLDKSPSSHLEEPLKENLDALIEIRDNSVHYFNLSPMLTKQVLEIGTASIQNFVGLFRRWFERDLSGYSLYLMPIGFVSASGLVALPTNPVERNLSRYLADLVKTSDARPESEFHVSMQVDVTLRRTPASHAAVPLTRDGTASDSVRVTVSEEDIRKTYRWDYRDLVARCQSRYVDFKANSVFHDARRQLTGDSRFVWTRFLDPRKPASGKKDFYNPNILQEFDRHYSRK